VQADVILAKDPDDETRCQVAGKIAALAPNLSEEDRETVGDIVTDILMTLANDQLARVRKILSEELKDVDNVSPDVIGRLARDENLAVAGPVLQASPLLSDELLVEIIKSQPVQGALSAISRRAALGENVSDAIIETDDGAAITELLKNGGAQIREETLDDLIERADGKPDWHAPLVGRPALSPNSVRHLAGFITESLLETLQNRDDIDPETARALSATVRERLDDETGSESGGDENNILDMFADGTLDENAIDAALNKGDRNFVVSALALKSGLSTQIIRKVVSMASAKGMVALAWKSGLSMKLAMQLQLRLARVAPDAVLKAAKGDKYPMSDEDMDWQLEFFAS
ncbi:MAG: DUF2336 domain-containing protein, partial [Rhodospirillales bacterium]|nr:DUF2336 domain-containing protein [Rhodospirillales bacterium]